MAGKSEIPQQSYFVHHNFNVNCSESSRFQNHGNYFNIFHFKNYVFFISERYIMKLHKSLYVQREFSDCVTGNTEVTFKIASYKKTKEIFTLKTFYSSGDLTLCGEKNIIGKFLLSLML